MSTKLTSLGAAHYILLTRSFIAIFGCIAIWWGAVEFPVFWRESSIEHIATQIIAGDPFKEETLTRQLPVMTTIERSVNCRAAALRSATIIRLRMMETTPSVSDRKRVDEQLASLATMIRSSLSCEPADPFLWLVLWWSEGMQNGFTVDNLKYLRTSYRLGPNEGWIALKRSRLAFAQFQQLPTDLSESVIDEFIGLVRSGFSQGAAEIFTGPARAAHNQILKGLKFVPDRYREQFSAALHRLD